MTFEKYMHVLNVSDHFFVHLCVNVIKEIDEIYLYTYPVLMCTFLC